MFKGNAYFVTAIGTNVGKTIVSAIITEALKADYWKPVQCGNLSDSDSLFMSAHTQATIHPEKHAFHMASSPHIASRTEGVNIKLSGFKLPETSNKLIVEGAGGMMVPLNDDKDLVVDIAAKLNLPLVIVTSCYLGSINHTLLTIEYAKQRNLPIEVIIFTGELVASSVEVIKSFYPDLNFAFVPTINPVTRNSIQKAAAEFKSNYLL